MLSFVNRTAPLYGLPIYFIFVGYNPILATTLYNVYLLFVVVSYLFKVIRLNNKANPVERVINTKAWVGSLAVMLVTVWGVITMSSWIVLFTGIVIVICIEGNRKEKLNKE